MPLHLTPERARGRLPRAGRATLLSAGLLLCSAAWPLPAEAHGVSGRASLPVPAWLFAWAAAIVLVVSFVLLSAMWSRPRLQQLSERRICAWPEWIVVPAGAIGLALFALVVYAGYDGVAAARANFDPTFIFIVFWVAVPLSSGVLGNWFGAFSPWRAFARAVRWGAALAGMRRR
ncbi:MAG TPA: hypothetical protein VGI27_08990, partial [Solirubrobacteraceae bacterium]